METIGRPTTIVSFSFPNGPTLEDVAAVVEQEAARGADLIALPETFLGQNDRTPETLDGPTVQAMSAIARRHRTYIVCPIDRITATERVNSAVLLDRDGVVAGVYDKVFPYWSEFDHKHIVAPGHEAPVWNTDFGRVGCAICFDVNFPEVWQRLADLGAELVIWPSAYSAGSSLQAHALNHHFAIVSATQTGDCLVYDITGKLVLDEQGPGMHVSRVHLDLDRVIFHENFNLAKRDQLLADHAEDIEQEVYMPREQWFVLKARRPGVLVHELARQYGLEPLRDYISRSRNAIDAMRVQPFANTMVPVTEHAYSSVQLKSSHEIVER